MKAECYLLCTQLMKTECYLLGTQLMKAECYLLCTQLIKAECYLLRSQLMQTECVMDAFPVKIQPFEVCEIYNVTITGCNCLRITFH